MFRRGRPFAGWTNIRPRSEARGSSSKTSDVRGRSCPPSAQSVWHFLAVWQLLPSMRKNAYLSLRRSAILANAAMQPRLKLIDLTGVKLFDLADKPVASILRLSPASTDPSLRFEVQTFANPRYRYIITNRTGLNAKRRKLDSAIHAPSRLPAPGPSASSMVQ